MVDRALRWLPPVLVCVLLVSVTRLAAHPLTDSDLWWHLRLGDDFLHQHSLATPAWSSFSDRYWVPTQPLAEIVMALFERWFGLPGVAWLFGCAMLAIVLALYHCARVRGERLASGVTVLLAVLGCSVALSPRPQLLSLVLLPVVVGAWLRTADDGEPRWWLVPLIGVWSLCHGFWFVGAGVSLVAALVISAERRADRGAAYRLLAVPVLSLALVALNPVGPGVFLAPFRVNATAHFIIEWQRTDLLSGAALAVESMVLITVAAWLFRLSRPVAIDLALLVAAVFFLWYSQRTVALASELMVPLLAASLQHLVARADSAPRHVTAVAWRERLPLLLTGGLCALLLAVAVPHTSATPGRVPARLDRELASLPRSTAVFDSYTVGGWLAWRHPSLQRYVDGLTDAYSAAHLTSYQRVVDVRPGWRRTLRAGGMHVAVIPEHGAMARALTSAGWADVAQDGGYSLLVAPSSTRAAPGSTR